MPPPSNAKEGINKFLHLGGFLFFKYNKFISKNLHLNNLICFQIEKILLVFLYQNVFLFALVVPEMALKEIFDKTCTPLDFS
jgi:hypothetical protein